MHRFIRRQLRSLAKSLSRMCGDQLVIDPAYCEDGLITVHRCDFVEDPRFIEAYRLGKSTGSWAGSELRWRAYVACWAADRARRMDGDFVDCGVFKGALVRTVMQYVDFASLPKKYYLLDTFRGLDDRLISDAERALGVRAGGYPECYDEVVETFKGLNVRIIPGTVPETLQQVDTNKVSYLSIDMNCAEPEVEAAEFFWDRLVSGAAVLLDDYGFGGPHLEQKRAMDRFAAEKGVPILLLPTGQGLMFRP